ncbi:PaaI family thioesterase [Paraperlucidibaca sp.]|uniref:PaaI family thioesterase n=1 Tax=Paraperlucidibaca sp. TaxID=2708021 RepID=UPI0030F38F0F
MAEPDLPYMEMAKIFFGESHPLFNAFGIKVDEAGRGRAVMKMPCVAEVCDKRGALHRGAITTLLDTNCGLAILAHLGDMRPIATIDLRVDFIAKPAVGEGVRGEVECYEVKGDVAYVRGVALGCSDDSLLASVSGCFAVGTLGPSFDSAMKEGDVE